jgi:hypothetical protein
MSYPNVDPGDVQTMNPVGTQEHSSGETLSIPQPSQYSPGEPKPTEVISKEMHETALNNAVAQAVTDMFKVNQEAWAPRNIVKFKIEYPSGQIALVKHLDTLDLVEFDLIEELDFFTRRLFPREFDDSGNPIEKEEDKENIFQALKDPKKRQRFYDMTGKLMEAAHLKPKVVHDGVAILEVGEKKVMKFGYQLTPDEQLEYFKKPIPYLTEDGTESYSGYADFNDRLHLFQELNKPLRFIEPFREGSTVSVQAVAGVEGSGDKTE